MMASLKQLDDKNKDEEVEAKQEKGRAEGN